MKVNDVVYVILNGSAVVQSEILKITNNLYTIRLIDGKVIRVPEHRLFATQIDAESSIPEYIQVKEVGNSKGFRKPDLH